MRDTGQEMRAETSASIAAHCLQKIAPSPPSPSPSSSYDPREYGSKNGIGTWAAAVLVVRGCIGASFLLMPYMMKRLGYVTGTVTVLVSGIVYYHTVHVLLSTEYELCKKLRVERLGYVEVADKILERSPHPVNKLRAIVRNSMYFFYSLPTSNAAYLILTADGVRSLARHFDVELSAELVITAEIVPLTVFCMVPRILDILVPYSSVSNFFTLIMAAATVASSVAYRNEAAAAGQPVAVHAFGDLYAVPECVAKCVKAYCCTSLCLPVKNDMRAPAKMTAACGALNAAATVVILFYYAFGAALYANYGDDVRDNVLHNLPPKSYLTGCVHLLYTVALYVSYVVAFFSRFNNVWCGRLKEYFCRANYGCAAEYGIRLAINALAYVLAVAVPNFALISAVAGTASFVVEVALPPTLELLSAYADRKFVFRVVLKDTVIIVVCLALFGMSFNSCAKQIVALYTT